jgi:endonuclease/exonuclease/phosphatase family metal-dependent hydrolase
VALQETIHDRRRAGLLGQLERSGRACGKPSRLTSARMFEVVSGPDRPRSAIPGVWRHEDGWRLAPLVDQELAIASRFPILRTDQDVFRAAAEEDVLAAKGVLHARIDVAGRPLEVNVTHLQAGDAHVAVRRTQFDELAEFVRATADPSAPILVMGDFNVQSNAAERRDDGSEYRALLRVLDEAIAPRTFADLWLQIHPEAPDAWSWTKPKRPWKPEPQRIDLMLLAGVDGMVPLTMARDFLAHGVVADGRPVGHLSNHAALIAELAWPVTVPSQQPIASAQP